MMGKALQCNNDWSGCDPPWDNGKGEKEEAVKADVQFNTCCPVRRLWIRREWVVREKVGGGDGGRQEKLSACQDATFKVHSWPRLSLFGAPSALKV